MNLFSLNPNSHLKSTSTKLIIILKRFLILFLSANSILIFSSCSSSKKFTGKEKIVINNEFILTPVRLLINDTLNNISFTAESPLRISDDEGIIAIVKKGNRIDIRNEDDDLHLTINNKTFSSESFRFSAEKLNQIFTFNDRKFRGAIVLNSNKIINVIPLEDYLKGVVPAEMPVGKGTEYFESLKVQAICARTYTLLKLNQNREEFDLHIDVRDQVYKGVDVEKEMSNKAVEETRGMVLTYDGELCVNYYSSTCGGYTEDAQNVFSPSPIPYLKSIKDGKDFYCSASPHFNWIEKYAHQEFVNRFVKAGLISSSDFSIQSIKINSRFYSGRVNELEINFTDYSSAEKKIKIYGNGIRNIIRSGNNKGILKSVMFDLKLEQDSVIITGKGSGHGVGMCQWGAMVQSKEGRSYEQIISHYFRGVEIERLLN